MINHPAKTIQFTKLSSDISMRDQAIINDAQRGISWRSIAQYNHISKQRVHQILTHYGYTSPYIRPKEQYKLLLERIDDIINARVTQNLSIKELQSRFPASRNVLIRFLKKYKLFTYADTIFYHQKHIVDTIIQYYKNGEPIRSIVTHMGISYPVIRRLLIMSGFDLEQGRLTRRVCQKTVDALRHDGAHIYYEYHVKQVPISQLMIKYHISRFKIKKIIQLASDAKLL